MPETSIDLRGWCVFAIVVTVLVVGFLGVRHHHLSQTILPERAATDLRDAIYARYNQDVHALRAATPAELHARVRIPSALGIELIHAKAVRDGYVGRIVVRSVFAGQPDGVRVHYVRLQGSERAGWTVDWSQSRGGYYRGH